MKSIYSVLCSLILLLSLCSVVRAAELLDVKPIVSGSSVAIEVTADVSMTYTYYKVPGQARAVVDIADADPEKVEPLIVVNKGAISSISVDKAQIAGIVVSRLVFNLVAEAEIFVKPSPDRKLLIVTFGSSAAAAAPPAVSPPKIFPEPAIQKADLPEIKKVEAAQPVVASPTKDEDDPLGLDDPPAQAQKSGPLPPMTPSGGTSPSSKTVKLEPVVPLTSGPSATVIRKIVAGANFIDIQSNGQVADFKVIKLSNPERMAIDVPGAKNSLAGKSVAINKFGISKVRIGVYPDYVRIVFDASKAEFPKYTVTNIKDGLRVSFK